MTTSSRIETTLAGLRRPCQVVGESTGPSFTRYVLQPDEGVRVVGVLNLARDLAVALGVESVRMDIDPDGIALEVPRDGPQLVRLIDMGSPIKQMYLPLALGRDVGGTDVWADLARMPHLLIAGATGTGKSVALNTLLISMIERVKPSKLRLLLIDAKRVELAAYAGLSHLWGPIVTEVDDAEDALAALVRLMERRYSLLAEHGAKDASEMPRWPRYVCVVDELADLVMSSKPVKASLIRLAQKARAAGIHLVLATQRPSSDVLSGLLKANVPCRIALAVASNTDSRVILDTPGAEDLLGRGDMLFKPPWLLEPVRLQGAYVSDEMIASTVAANTPFVPEFEPEPEPDYRRRFTLLILAAASWTAAAVLAVAHLQQAGRI